MEEGIHRIVTDLETHSTSLEDPLSQTPIPESTLSHLQALSDNALSNQDPNFARRLFEELSLRQLSPASLIRTITATMDFGPTHLALSASKVYLSLILSPTAPVFTLFTPMAFLSLLRSIRRALKPQSPAPVQEDRGQRSAVAVNRKRKSGGRGKASRNRAHSDVDNCGQDEREDSSFGVRVLFAVLERLERVLGLVHLGRFPDSLKSLIHTVAEIPVMALELSGGFGNYDKLCDFCWRIMNELLKSQHGGLTITAAEILKSLSPLIFLLKSQARTSALGFIKCWMMAAARESDEIRKAIVNFPRYLAQNAPEKSEPRALAVESITEIVCVMGLEDQIAFTDYVVKMTLGKSHLRLLAVDLIPALTMSLEDPLMMNSESEVKNSWGLRCLEALIQRCSDVNAGIRARAMSNVAQLVGFFSGDDRSQSLLKEVLGFGDGGHKRPECGISELLSKNYMDEKASVRKAVLLLITKLTALLGGAFDAEVLNMMGMACSDPLVSIRKAAVSALSEAFRKFLDENVTIEWLHSVPQLITDNESSIQEECENLFLELVLDRISRVGSKGSPYNKPLRLDSNLDSKNFELFYPEGILGILKEICNGEVTPWVRKICKSLGKKKRLKPTIAAALQNIIKTSEALWLSHSKPIEKWTAPDGAWLLLSEVSVFLSKAVDWEFLHHHWLLLDKCGLEGEFRRSHVQGDVHEEVEGLEPNAVVWARDRVFLLQTISNVSVVLPSEPAANLAHSLLKRLENFNMHSTEVNAHIKALRTLCQRKAFNPEETDVLVSKWVHQLLSKASQILEAFISKNSDVNKENSLITPPGSGRKGKKASEMSSLLSRATTACYTIGSLVIVCPSVNMNAIITILHTIITAGSFDPKLNKLTVPVISVKQTALSLYIQAWLTMGKICLADGKLAKKYIPLFMQTLEKSDCAALRNNVVMIMADFCVRYTALVDCYIPKITKCLCDPCELVRRQTFILLSRLLQRDYVKWRGVLFLRFLLSLVDESDKIRQLADFLFGNILKAKAPLLAYNSFVEAIFVLNDCHAYNVHMDSQSLQADSRLFSIKGNDESSRFKRMHIYVTLLKQMAQEQLLATFAKLCAEILAAASDGMLDIEDTSGQSVLQDAFQILSCKEIRIASNCGPQSELAYVDEEGGASAVAARGRAITQAVKRGLIQNTIPIFIELKRLLESKKSPLTGSLMECLRILLKDYKNEIDDILVADKQLQKELLYDMQKYELDKAKSTVAEAVASMQILGSHCTPGASKGSSRCSMQKKFFKNSMQKKFTKKLQSDSKMASAMADVAAAATARSVLKEANQKTSTPPLSSISVPKLKPSMGEAASHQGNLPGELLHSLRRRQTYSSDEES